MFPQFCLACFYAMIRHIPLSSNVVYVVGYICCFLSTTNTYSTCVCLCVCVRVCVCCYKCWRWLFVFFKTRNVENLPLNITTPSDLSLTFSSNGHTIIRVVICFRFARLIPACVRVLPLFFLLKISLNCSCCNSLLLCRAYCVPIIIVRKFDHDTIDEDREMANCRNTLIWVNFSSDKLR